MAVDVSGRLPEPSGYAELLKAWVRTSRVRAAHLGALLGRGMALAPRSLHPQPQQTGGPASRQQVVSRGI